MLKMKMKMKMKVIKRAEKPPRKHFHHLKPYQIQNRTCKTAGRTKI